MPLAFGIDANGCGRGRTTGGNTRKMWLKQMWRGVQCHSSLASSLIPSDVRSGNFISFWASSAASALKPFYNTLFGRASYGVMEPFEKPFWRPYGSHTTILSAYTKVSFFPQCLKIIYNQRRLSKTWKCLWSMLYIVSQHKGWKFLLYIYSSWYIQCNISCNYNLDSFFFWLRSL